MPDKYAGLTDRQAELANSAGENAVIVGDKLFSDEADTCEDCAAAEFTIVDGTIRDPGKFEVEPLAAYHAYHVMLDGFADDDDGPDWRIGNVICHEFDSGFVCCDIFDSEEEAIAHWAATTPDYDEEEGEEAYR